MTATTILTNGHIQTMDPSYPVASAVAIRDDKILAVGSDDIVTGLADVKTKTINLNGRCVSPGLVDAHVHFQGYALSLQVIRLGGASSLEEVLQRISAGIIESPPQDGGWIRGHGWAQDEWQDRAFPTAAHLDRIAPNLPVFLRHKSGHAAWVNSRALQIAGIDASTPDPPGGEIQRDAEGRPTGILLETSDVLVRAHLPQATSHQLASAMHRAQETCWQAGLTGIHDFDGPDCFQALQILRDRGQLGMRIVKNIPVAELDHAISLGLRSGFGDDWLRIGGIKIFADGALGPRTATMIAPYENEPDNFGIVVTDKEEMMEQASQASAHGLSVTVHAIGDRANHDVLDVYEAVRQEESQRADSSRQPALRHRIEHVQILHPQDLHRLAELNVIASMQPIHATSDMIMADTYWGDRARYSYAWRTALETGATLVFGSDAPVEPIEPLLGIYAAVSRRRPDGQPGPNGWYPEQKLTMHETIHAFTRAAALTSGQEARQGSLSPGKLADLTIFDRDIFAIPTDELLDVQIAGTMVGGRFKYRNW